MKKIKTSLLLFIIGLLMASCATTSFYQIYTVQPTNNLKIDNNSIVYEDENCSVFYDFWEEGGNVGFMFYNKSNKDIQINMNECFFILNGIAYDYYQNREFSKSKSTSQTTGYTNSATVANSSSAAVSVSTAVSGYNYRGNRQTNSISTAVGGNRIESSGISKSAAFSNSSSFGEVRKEKESICIPPNSAKIISEYCVNDILYRDCNLFRYPSEKQVKTAIFTNEESPYQFSNRISYTIEGTDEPIKVEHNFFVSAIANYPDYKITESKFIKLCDDEKHLEVYQSTPFLRFFKEAPPYKFYLKYMRITNASRLH